MQDGYFKTDYEKKTKGTLSKIKEILLLVQLCSHIYFINCRNSSNITREWNLKNAL